MAEWFTAEQRLAVLRRYGPSEPGEPIPELKAIAEARALDPDVDELWGMRGSFDQEEFSRLLWPRVLRALKITGEEPPKKPRHRPPSELSVNKLRDCERELEQREKAGRPRTGPFTLDAIAERVRLPRTRLRQLERLRELGWPLSRSDPDFLTDDGYVRLPSIEKAARLQRSR